MSHEAFDHEDESDMLRRFSRHIMLPKIGMKGQRAWSSLKIGCQIEAPWIPAMKQTLQRCGARLYFNEAAQLSECAMWVVEKWQPHLPKPQLIVQAGSAWFVDPVQGPVGEEALLKVLNESRDDAGNNADDAWDDADIMGTVLAAALLQAHLGLLPPYFYMKLNDPQWQMTPLNGL